MNADDIRQAINPRLNRVLKIAAAALPDSQFKAFRSVVLDEFGNSGLAKDLERLMTKAKQQERQGTDRM